jgi:hypothetical protein
VRLALALVAFAACTRTVYVRVPVAPPPCRTADAPRPSATAVPFNAEWVDWLSFQLLPWVRDVERSCPAASAASVGATSR